MVDFKGKSVAVVGSSGNLLERNYTSLIDSHDIVMRFNQARVIGFEDFVGNKTTHRIVNIHTFLGTSGNDRFPNNDPMFVPKLDNQNIILNRPVTNSQLKLRSPNNPVDIISDEFWNFCRETLHNKKDPSVGFIGVLLSVQTATKVNVFGFDQENTTDKKHYWEDVKALGHFHDFNIEKQIFSELENQKLITIFR